MLNKIIKNRNKKKVQSKFETWKYNVCRLKEQEQVHKLKKVHFYNTGLRELKSVVSIKNKMKNIKNHVTFIGSDYIKNEIVLYKEYYGVNKLPKFVCIVKCVT